MSKYFSAKALKKEAKLAPKKELNKEVERILNNLYFAASKGNTSSEIVTSDEVLPVLKKLGFKVKQITEFRFNVQW